MPGVASSPGFPLLFLFGFILNKLFDLLFGFVDVLATVKDHFNHLKYLVELFICHDFCLHSYPLLPHTLPCGFIVTKSRMRFKCGVVKRTLARRVLLNCKETEETGKCQGNRGIPEPAFFCR